jgi:hypothetical protein
MARTLIRKCWVLGGSDDLDKIRIRKLDLSDIARTFDLKELYCPEIPYCSKLRREEC